MWCQFFRNLWLPIAVGPEEEQQVHHRLGGQLGRVVKRREALQQYYNIYNITTFITTPLHLKQHHNIYNNVTTIITASQYL
jgi:hypothetical protein